MVSVKLGNEVYGMVTAPSRFYLRLEITRKQGRVLQNS